MDLYVARQPIFDRNKSVVGYELLHRESGRSDEYAETDGEFASSRVITSAFLSIGLESLTNGKLAFINFTGDLLTSGVASLLPKDLLVVEILETVSPTKEILAACEQLKAAGYLLALDDYVLEPAFGKLANIADIIKVDFRMASEENQRLAIQSHRNKKTMFLAEKIETEEEFRRAAELGYTLFQGFFFAKPVIVKSNAMLAGKLGYVRLMQAVNTENPDIRAIVSAIESDAKLALETIKLSNSAFYGRRQKISSIRQAVVALGLEGIRKWIYLASMRRLITGKPDELVSTSVIRSKFMELIAAATDQLAQSPVYSMLGLFSLLDVMTSCPFEVLLAGLNISEDIKDVLVLGCRDSAPGKAYHMMIAYEHGLWEEAAALSAEIGMSMDAISTAYIDSLRWYNECVSVSKG